MKRSDKGTKNAKNDLYLKFTFAEEGVLYSCKTGCLDNVDPNVYSDYPGKYALAIPETLNFPFSVSERVGSRTLTALQVDSGS